MKTVRSGTRRDPRGRLLGALLGLLVTTACGEGDRSAVPDDVGSRPASRPAPVEPFLTLGGDSVSLADYRGRVVVLNLWGTWCAPCRREIPELVELARAYADGEVAVIGLAVESGSSAEIREFADEFEIEYELWMADMSTAVTRFDAIGFPFTLLIDREGMVRREYLGPQTLETLTGEIETLLR